MPQFVDHLSAWTGNPIPYLHCDCLAEITLEDLERGYCSGCCRTLTVQVGAAHFGASNA